MNRSSSPLSGYPAEVVNTFVEMFWVAPLVVLAAFFFGADWRLCVLGLDNREGLRHPCTAVHALG